MGTRGACGFLKDGKLKVAYNHFDSYPDHLGADILEFVRAHTNERMVEMCDGIELIDEDKPPTPEQKKQCAGTTDLKVSNQSDDDWYCLLRHAQGDLAAYANVGFMPDAEGFLNDSLFCEYAYIINLDDSVLEVYKGFQSDERPEGRFGKAAKSPGNGGYWPVGLVNTFTFEAVNELEPGFPSQAEYMIGAGELVPGEGDEDEDDE